MDRCYHAVPGWLCALLLALTVTSGAQASEANSDHKYYTSNPDSAGSSFLCLGLGLVINSAYTDALKESYSDRDVSGGGAWVYLDAGFGIRIAPNVFMVPRLSMLGTFVEYENSFGLPSSLNSKKATMIFLPGIGGRYQLTSKPSSLFATADMSLILVGSDLESPDLEPDGISIGAGMGYSFNGEYEFSIFYRHIPCKLGDVQSANLGGIGLSIGRRWSF